jgi:PAS domain S-box-containing protein
MATLQQHEQPFELVNDSVMTRTMEGRIDFWNHSAEELYGWRKEEAIGRVSHDLLQTQFPKPLEEIESELAQNGRWEGKLVHTTRNGGRVVVESRWSLDLKGQSGAVIEINRRSTDPQARTDTDAVEVGSQEPLPASKLIKADDLLPKIANIVLAGGAFLCILVLFYIIYHYGWTGERQFTGLIGMILYYGLTSFLAALLFSSLRMPPAVRIRLALVLTSTCISLYASEIILAFSDSVPFASERTLWFPPNTKAEVREIVNAAKKFGVDFDTRGKLQVISDLSQRGVNAVPAVIPSALLKQDGNAASESEITINGTNLLPLGGISNTVTVLCNENGHYTIYKSDEHGFHNPKGIWDSGRPDIATVGDSYTHGACVSSDKNFVALIRKHYPATLNLGMSGDGPLMELAKIKEYVRFIKPRVVLWFFYEGNDLEDLKKERNSPLLMHYLEGDSSQGLLHLQSDIDAALAAYIKKEREHRSLEREPQHLPEGRDETTTKATGLRQISAEIIKLSNLRRRLGLIYATTTFESVDAEAGSDAEMHLLGKILLQAKTAVGQWGGTLYFVYLPERERYVDERKANQDDKNRERVLGIARSAGLPVIDVNEVFQSQQDPLELFPFRRLGHYNEQGNRVVAETVLQAMSPEPVLRTRSSVFSFSQQNSVPPYPETN